MGYRRDEEGLRLRIAELEGELSDARVTVARLRGDGASEVPRGGGVDWLTGVPKQLYLERELPFEITDEGLEAIAELANQRVAGGSLANVGRTLTHRKGQYELRVCRMPDGRTNLRLTGGYSAARVLLALGGPGIGFLTGGLATGIAEAIGAGGRVMALIFFAGMLAGFVGLRRLMQKGMAKDRNNLTGLFEAACDVATAHPRPPATKRRFVETTNEDVAALEAVADQEASEEALEAEIRG